MVRIKTGFFYQHPLQFKVKSITFALSNLNQSKFVLHNNIGKPDSFPIINTYFGNSTSFYS